MVEMHLRQALTLDRREVMTMSASPERHRSFLAVHRGILKIRLLPHPFRGRKPLFSPLSVARCQCSPFGHVRRSRRYIGFLGF